MKHVFFFAVALITAVPGSVLAQSTPAQAAPPVQAPAPQAPAAPMPPAGSGPVFRSLAPRCEPDNLCLVDGLTYLYYIETRPSVGSEGRWVPWSADIAESLRRDFNRLWATNFLDDLSIEVVDNTYPNGVVAKDVIIHMHERQRVKIVDYQGSKRVDTSAIEEKLRELGIIIRIDTFIDPTTIKRVSNVVREMYAEKGYQYADVKPEIKIVAGGPKLVHLTFHVTEGPKVKIREVDFVGNTAIKDGKLRGRMKENKPKGLLSFITGAGTYQEAKFADDAEAVTGYYLDRGYIRARVGQPQIEILEDSQDGTTRWIRLRVPVDEGPRYRVGTMTFEGNTMVADEAFASLFKLKPGDWYSHKKFMKGREKAQEVYGAGGYMEFNAYPDFPEITGEATEKTDGPPAPPAGAPGDKPVAPAAPQKPLPPNSAVTNMVVRVEEGPQYFVNRITFIGNSTTRDSVIRRDLRVYEAGVFNTEGLKQSIRRINQLGYFKPLEGNADVKVEKAPGEENKVDVTLKVEEQNRNMLTFGAGISQFEGFFGSLSFQTANFLGRGETLSISLQEGSRAKNYQVAFTEPFLFDRPITAGVDLFVREIRYIGQFTQASRGGNTVWGFPLANFTRLYAGYSFEDTEVKDIDPLFTDPKLLSQYLLLGEEGRRRVSKVSPSVVHNTVDNPIFASSGKRYSASFDLAGIGGGSSFWSTRLEGIQYVPLTRRVSLGFRVQGEYVRPYGDTAIINEETGRDGLPIFEKLFLGGEYSVRGYDVRTISPRDGNGFIIGGNKTLLFNGELLVNIAGPVRALLFYDAGQAKIQGERLRFPDFKTSTGAELRFFMPVLNVPFRLIFSYNPQRDGVFDNQLLPQKRFTFKFAVGSTF
ncbi:MAG: BamA/TamA family outer membrane protein [Acidobacteriota bacterium]|nr:BamA/TamA family outer membrane protein [Acidobacteriota bacterium]